MEGHQSQENGMNPPPSLINKWLEEYSHNIYHRTNSVSML